jgi:hypothetical protein
MLTDSEREIFTKMLDANWDAVMEKNQGKKQILKKVYSELEAELKTKMGEDRFNEFMSKGQRMFS